MHTPYTLDKNNFRFLEKACLYLQTIVKALVKFQKDPPNTVGRVARTKYQLEIQGPVVQSIVSLMSSLRSQLVKCFTNL